MPSQAIDHPIHSRHLRRAALLALRGHGGAEPNPMVGCVIVSPAGETVGWGYHRQVGGPHAEIVALNRAGDRARGATLYCTLEPCNHHGRTGPCAQAVIDAGLARVIIARREPWSTAGGGLERIAAAGIETRVVDACAIASEVSAPFVHRLTTGLPWITVKWAQTLDGALALPASAGRRWISNEASRRMVHRERGRVDAIMTGVGTVIADDPLLTPRNVRLRRAFRSQRSDDLPIRIVIDPRLRTPVRSRLVQTAREHPLLIACAAASADSDAARRLQAGGAEVIGIETADGELPLAPLLKQLVATRDITHVLVEAGPGLMTRLFRQRLVNEAWVFTAPLRAGQLEGLPSVHGMVDADSMQPWSQQRRGGDASARYRVL